VERIGWKCCFSAQSCRYSQAVSILRSVPRDQTSTFRENSLPTVRDVPLRVPRVRIDCTPRSLRISLASGRYGGNRDFPGRIDDFQRSNFCCGGDVSICFPRLNPRNRREDPSSGVARRMNRSLMPMSPKPLVLLHVPGCSERPLSTFAGP
jgi:hypothetical protein